MEVKCWAALGTCWYRLLQVGPWELPAVTDGPGGGRRDLLRWGCSYPGGPRSLCSAQPDVVLLEEPWVLVFCWLLSEGELREFPSTY